MGASVVDTKPVDPQSTELLSRIVGQKLTPSDLQPHVVFLACLVVLLLGVAYADQQVGEAEKERLLTTLYRFLPPDGNERRLIHLMIRGVRECRIYDRPHEIQILTAPLSEAEKLLLIGFGYVMAIADGCIQECEKQYLSHMAAYLGVNAQCLAVLESRFCGQKLPSAQVIAEVRSLLDPARFHELNAVVVKAAKDILSILPDQAKDISNQAPLGLFYQELDKFKERRKQVATAYYNLLKIIKDCNHRKLVSDSLVTEAKRGLEELLSQRFRLSIVGEFSQGKSTLLNAIMGEEIQPVRAIPCNGTVAVLRYGIEKRVICRYKDGREEEIPVENYKDKVSIAEDAALGCIGDALVQSDLEEIVFEHPELSFCRSGIEIIDSPGLNEHPERTAITQKLLKDTDAVVFITNASKPLTWGERELLRELQRELSYGQANVPASNLFLVVNFVDLLRRESDRQQVRQLVERFAQGQDPVLCGEDRIHFISAREALDAIQSGTADEYSAALQRLTRSLETFLVEERGIIELRKSITKHIALIQACLQGIHQAQDVLTGELKIPGDTRQQIIEQIGHATGIDVNLRLLTKRLKQEVNQQTSTAWNNWLTELRQRLEKKSSHWSSSGGIFKPKEMAQSYANQFIEDLRADFSTWQSEQLQPILEKYQSILNLEIQAQLKELQYDLKSLGHAVNADFQYQFNVAVSVIEPEIDTLMNAVGVGLGVMGGFSGAALIAFEIGKLALLPMAGVGLAVAVISSVVLSIWNAQQQTEGVKKKVFDVAWEKFQESQAESLEQICTSIGTLLDDRVVSAGRAIQQAIFLYESLLEQQERYTQQALSEQQAERMWLNQTHQELQQLQNHLTSIGQDIVSRQNR